MVCEYDKNIVEYLYQTKDTESHEDSDFCYDCGCNMKDCSICKYCDEDFIFDEETGEEYLFYGCQKGNDTSLDYECKDFEEFMRNDR